MDIKKEIASRITKSRKEIGITIKELSARIGTLSAGRISNWEQGTRSPGPVEAMLLAKQLQVSASYLLCLTSNPQGELSSTTGNGPRFIPVLTMKDASHAKEILDVNSDDFYAEKIVVVDEFNKSRNSDCLFALSVEDNSMEPIKHDDLVIIDGDLTPNPGDYVLVYLTAKKQTVLRKYGEADGCVYQLLAGNELWATVSIKNESDAVIIGVVVEHRAYL